MYLICESPLFIFRGEEFRQDFGRLQDLLSIFPGVPALVVTATASVPVRDKIIKSLSLQDPTLVTAHPDRQNISYSKRVRRPAQDKRDDLDEILLPIAGGLRQQKHWGSSHEGSGRHPRQHGGTCFRVAGRIGLILRC